MSKPRKERYLTDAQCQETAARLSREMKEDREGREKYDDAWRCYVDGRKGPKPAYLVIPGDLETGKEVIRRLYSPAEAEIIIKHLTTD